MSVRAAMIALTSALTFQCLGQSASTGKAIGVVRNFEVGPGIVVTEASKGFEAEKAGMKPGDLIVGWSRDKVHGSIDSPFDLTRVDVEQRPLGAVTFTGYRGRDRLAWTLGSNGWSVKTRPNFSKRLLYKYQTTSRLLRQRKVTLALQSWPDRLPNSLFPDWLASWILLYKAQILIDAGRMRTAAHLADVAIQKAPKGDEIIGPYALKLLLNSPSVSNWRILKHNFEEQSTRDASTLIQVWTHYLVSYGFMTGGDLARAARILDSTLPVIRKLSPDSFDVVRVIAALAYTAIQRDELNGITSNLEDAIRICKRNGDANDLQIVEAQMASVLGLQGDLIGAERYARESLAVVGVYGLASESTRSEELLILGIVAEQRDQLDAAEHYFKEALRVGSHGHPYWHNRDAAIVYGDLAMVAEDRGLLHQALSYYGKALRIHRRYSDVLNIMLELNNVARIERKFGWLSPAELCLKQAAAIEGNQDSRSHVAAETFYELGAVELERRDLDKAQKNFEQALGILVDRRLDIFVHVKTLMGLAQVARLRGEVRQADEFFGQAFAALESQAVQIGDAREFHLGFRGKHSEYYPEYIDFLIESGQKEKAISFMERSHARTLLESLTLAHVDITKGANADLVERQHDLQNKVIAESSRRLQLMSQGRKEELKKVEERMAELLTNYNAVEGQLRSASALYADLTQPKMLTMTEIQHQFLDGDTLLLEFSLGQNHSYAFALTQTSLQVFHLPGRAVIEAQARIMYRQLAQRRVKAENVEVPQYLHTASILSHILLRPLGLMLKQRRLLIVADGALQYIPFAMLPEPTTKPGAPQVPLIVNHEIVNLPSASVLAVLRDQQKNRASPTKSVAVLADPVFDKHDPRVTAAPDAPPKAKMQVASLSQPRRNSATVDSLLSLETDSLTRSAVDVGLSRGGKAFLPRLRYSRQEAESIAAVAPKDQSFVAMDFDATRAAAMSPELSQYRIVHFATHGLLDSQHPELSGLVFSLVDKQGNPQDGFLTLQDIYNLNLPADLVVLSGCETGLGKEISGEGLVGLTRGFMYAGATRVIASLWKVSDAATAKLMAELYRGIETEGMRPAEALRAAQIKMWKEKRWSAPYYWAGFQIQGEWK